MNDDQMLWNPKKVVRTQFLPKGPALGDKKTDGKQPIHDTNNHPQHLTQLVIQKKVNVEVAVQQIKRKVEVKDQHAQTKPNHKVVSAGLTPIWFEQVFEMYEN